MTAPVYLTDDEVRGAALPIGELADALVPAFRKRSEGVVMMPAKTGMHPSGSDAYFHSMPALVPGVAAGVKWVAGSPSNSSRGLAHIHAHLILSNAETGAPIAVVEAGYLTGLRTAALSLLAARSLARPEAKRLGFIGCGFQAQTHLQAFAEEFPVRQVAFYGPRQQSVTAFKEHVAECYGLATLACSHPGEVLASSDIVVSTVPAHRDLEGFLDARALPEGAFVSMVDLGRSWDAATVGDFDRCLTDDRAQSEALAHNNAAFSTMSFSGDLSGLLTGDVEGRRSASERIAFLFPGVALADIVAGQMILERVQATPGH